MPLSFFFIKGRFSKDLSEVIVKDNYKKFEHKSLKIELDTYYSEYKDWSIGIAFKHNKMKSPCVIN